MQIRLDSNSYRGPQKFGTDRVPPSDVRNELVGVPGLVTAVRRDAAYLSWSFRMVANPGPSRLGGTRGITYHSKLLCLGRGAGT